MSNVCQPTSLAFDASAEAIQSWIVTRVAQLLGVGANEIQPTDVLSDFGMESVEAFTLSGELSDLLGLKLSPTLVWDFPAISDLAQYLAAEKKAASAGNPR
jgi:8-amino-7-oxononanoate synthase